MSAQAVIDSLEFAQAGQTLRGNLPVSGMARLQDDLYDDLGEVEFVVQGGTDAWRRPVLMLEVRGVLHLRCQRCLGVLDYPLRLANRLLLVSEAEAAPGAPDDEGIEWVEASAALDVAGLVEDEVLLGLPYAPRHDEGCCTGDADLRQERSKPSPFAKLAALKKDR